LHMCYWMIYREFSYLRSSIRTPRITTFLERATIDTSNWCLNRKCMYLLSRVGWYTRRKWRVLFRMIGFISTLVTHSLLITLTESYHSFTHFTAHRCTRTRILRVH
jgi:hypothetical protein